MTETEFPKWIKITDLAVGLVSLVAAIFVVLDTHLAHYTLVLALIVALFAIGLARAARGAAVKSKGTPRRITNISIGMLVIVLIGFVIFLPGLSEIIQIRLIASSFLLMGIARVIIGIIEDDVPRNPRILQFIVGILTIVVSVIVLIAPVPEFVPAILFLGTIAAMNGLSRIARGYVGV
ncbi:MAG: hypothetical protein ACTSUB_10325 [Candidatus Thorarchaeota archaeon]